MYTLIRERRQSKDLLLQVLFLGVAFFVTERFVDYLVEEKQLFPESFTLESSLFLATWFGLDLLVCLVSRQRSCLESLLRFDRMISSLPSLILAWVIAELFFKFHSFVLESLALLGLWFLLDFTASKLLRKARSSGEHR